MYFMFSNTAKKKKSKKKCYSAPWPLEVENVNHFFDDGHSCCNVWHCTNGRVSLMRKKLASLNRGSSGLIKSSNFEWILNDFVAQLSYHLQFANFPEITITAL